MSPFARARANVDALRALREVQHSGTVTPEQQQTIARWSGWGAIPHIFDEHNEEFAGARKHLQELLDPQLFAAARRTTINAHYTDAEIVTAMWDHLRDLGFDGGRVLEPGSGSGNFIGLMPDDLREFTTITGIELDPVSANISRALYPDARVRTESFADSPYPSGGVDAVIGNVPFGQVKLYDPRHNTANLPIHDHFIVKSIDLVRPGGTIAVLTSRYTLDKQDETARRAIYAQADLVGAFRLPRGAHRRAAGTEVVTDVLIFHKREPGAQPASDHWLASVEREDGLSVNQHFTLNPEHVLGQMVLGHGLHGPDLEVRSDDLAAVPEQLREQMRLSAAQAREAGSLTHTRPTLDEGAPPPRVPPTEEPVAQAGDPSRFTGYIDRDGDDFTQMIDGRPEPFPVPKSRRAEMHTLLDLRDTTVELLAAEAATTSDTINIQALRLQLNQQYDAYVAKHGPINRVTQRRTGRVDPDGNDIIARVLPRAIAQFASDPFSAPVRALEQYDESSGEATKAAIFTRRILERRDPVNSADSPADALAICLDQKGLVDLLTMASLLDSKLDETREALGTLVFDDPSTGELVPRAEYLSGDVRQKLLAAEAAAETDPQLQVNVEHLRQVVPADLGPEEIHASLGAVWIPPEDVEAFLQETLDDASITVRHGTGAMWSISGNPSSKKSVAATSQWGTERLNALDLASRLLQQQETVIRDEIDNGDGSITRVVNPEATDAATEKATAMRDRFAEWVWEDPDRAARLAATYNTMFNSTVLRSYDGEHLSLPGLASWFTPHPHQRAAVHRMIAEPATGLFHQVGAGKTAEMVIGTQELRRLGMINKPAIIVPNHMLEQFTRETLSLYPRANVLAASTEDLRADKRRLFVAKAATGDWDAIIMTRGAFHSLPVSAETERAYMEREQANLRGALDRMAGDEGGTRMVKRLETQLANNEERLKRAMDQRRDSGLTFEQLGIDHLVVDELHHYKNMRIVSSIRDAAHPGSQRAIDLDMKIDWLRRNSENGRVFTGATATPIANSVAEAYVMQRYIRPDLLEDVGITDFDSWAATFGETLTQVELAPEGGGNYRTSTRFAKFRNVPELLNLWHVAADVKTAEDLTYLTRPNLHERADGHRVPETVLIAPSDDLSAYVADLGERAERVRSRQVDPSEDNMLKVSGDGRAAALDMRLVGVEPNPGNGMPTKIEAAADRIHSIWRTHRHDAYPASDGPEGAMHPARGSLQIVFCDLGTPTGSNFNVYGHLRDELVERGMDPARVKFIHDAPNDRKKALLFEQCRTGQVDVLIGSTSKMGVGTNIQTRAVALHHLDCPWRPADIEQREGRILRQGNLNPEVGIYRYVVEGSFDAYSWQTVERKAKFIDQIMRGRLDQRDIEDIGDNTLSFNEVKALASGDPLILERAEVEQEVTTLTRLERSHARAQSGLRGRIDAGDRDLNQVLGRIPLIEQAITQSVETKGDAFAATIAGTRITDRPTAAAAVRHALGEQVPRLDKYTRPEITVPGAITLGGHVFDGHLRARQLGGGTEVRLIMRALPDVSLEVDLAEAGHGIITKTENAVTNLPRHLARAHEQKQAIERDLSAAADSLGAPFARADDLTAAKARLADIDAKMAAKSAEASQPPTTSSTSDTSVSAPDQTAPGPTSPTAHDTHLHHAAHEAREQLQRHQRAEKPPQPTQFGGSPFSR
ncbi:helicase [Janibacter indicus]|uniref:Helicase n=1 Tax=Janibacter indicus TaxID=857417 RepID=A0A7L9IZA6_9MICO|nr:helicase-related protein [Janibacter indicus]QOK22332.1 helicase [Janibacter indicus]